MLWQFRINHAIVLTTDFDLAMYLAKKQFEEKKEKLQQKKKETQPKDWDKEFQTMLENYIPENPEKAKYEGGE